MLALLAASRLPPITLRRTVIAHHDARPPRGDTVFSNSNSNPLLRLPYSSSTPALAGPFAIGGCQRPADRRLQTQDDVVGGHPRGRVTEPERASTYPQICTCRPYPAPSIFRVRVRGVHPPRRRSVPRANHAEPRRAVLQLQLTHHAAWGEGRGCTACVRHSERSTPQAPGGPTSTKGGRAMEGPRATLAWSGVRRPPLLASIFHLGTLRAVQRPHARVRWSERLAAVVCRCALCRGVECHQGWGTSLCAARNQSCHCAHGIENGIGGSFKTNVELVRRSGRRRRVARTFDGSQ